MADGGGGRSSAGSGSAFEARFGRVETELGHLRGVTEKIDAAVTALRNTVEDLRIDYARFDERSKHFPTKGFIFSTAATMLGAVGGLTALIVRFLPPAH